MFPNRKKRSTSNGIVGKAILLNSQGILLFGTPGGFAFSQKDMFKELFCHQLNVRRDSNLEL